MEAVGDRTKVLYLALDACDPDTMLELAGAGHCPNIAGLLAEGAAVETVAPYGTFVGSTWMTVATGTEVGRHRYYNWVQVAEGRYDLRHTSPREAHGTPFWQTLSDGGRRLAVLDVPHSQVPDTFNGAFLKEWGCHDRHHGTGSSPPELLDELNALVGGGHPYGSMVPTGDDQFAPCDYTVRAGPVRTLDEERQIYDLILRGIEAKRDVSLHLLEQGGWDLFMNVLGESHCVGHQLWHVHDLDHPRHDPAARRLLGDPLVEVYARLDAVVGEHLAAAGPDATCYVHLSHGMGPHYDGDHLLDEVLRRIDEADRSTLPTGWRTRVARDALQRLPASVADRLQPVTAAALRRRITTAPPVVTSPPGPRADRRWYQIPNNTVVGAVRFNIVDREPAGIVDPGQVADLTELITRRLLEVINVDTGRPAVQRVLRVDEVLDRFEGDAFPDLFVEWDRSVPIERVWSPTIGTVFAPYEHWRTGDHHDRGLLLAAGAGIAPGRRARSMRLTEVAPTLAAALGDELPGIDGRPRLDLVATGSTPVDAPLADEAPPAAGSPRRPGWLTRLASGSNRRGIDADGRVAEGALELAQAALVRAEAAQVAQAALEQEVATLRHAAHDLERANLVWTTMRWLDAITVDEDRLVSVVTPTHERPEGLADAIRSVLVQRYQRWEMVVVDDGGDTAKSVVAEIGDERVRSLRIPHGGPAAARNAALEAVTGSVVTYLDDDNTLDPGWLKAVVWAFQHHPESDVLYGARMIDDLERVHERGEGGMPWLQFNAFDFDRLQDGNIADMGVIAHRAGLPEARFDERLWEYADWDILLALTEHRTPLELPAVALYYRTVGERLSGAHEGDRAIVLEKWQARRAAREA